MKALVTGWDCKPAPCPPGPPRQHRPPAGWRDGAGSHGCQGTFQMVIAENKKVPDTFTCLVVPDIAMSAGTILCMSGDKNVYGLFIISRPY